MTDEILPGLNDMLASLPRERVPFAEATEATYGRLYEAYEKFKALHAEAEAELERLRKEDADLRLTVNLLGSSLNLVGEHAETATAQRDQLATLVRILIGPDECRFDHLGGCQAHDFPSLGPGNRCPHAEAKELLATIDKTKAPGT